MSRFEFTSRNKPLLILVICGFLLYANTLGHDFNIDDGYYTAGNRLMESVWSSIGKVFSNPTLFGPKGVGYDYRPVAATTFILQHQLFGSGPMAGHLVNICLYLLTVVVLFKLLVQWVHSKSAIMIAFWISLLFLVHPLHTEVVASIKSRDELLALLFSLLSLWFWINFFKDKKIYNAFLAPIFFSLALFSKYTILPFLIYIPLALHFFHVLNMKKSLWVLLLLLLTGIVCHTVKTAILPPSDHFFSITENGLVAKGFTLEHRLATSFYVMGRYILLHVFPVKLVYYYGFQYVPVVGSANAWAWLSLVVYLGLAVWCFINRNKKSLLLFGLLLFLGHIFIYSNLVELAPGMMAERFTYGASLGFCIAVVLLLYNYRNGLEKRIKIASPGILIFLLSFGFAMRTLIRNQDWKNKETLYVHDVKEAPESAMVNYLYGDWLLASSIEAKKNALVFRQYSPTVEQQVKAKIRESQVYFNRTLAINPLDTLAQYNLASSFIQLDDFKSAEDILSHTVKEFPKYAEAYFTLGLSQVYQKKQAEAIANFKKLLQLDPNFVIGYEQLNRVQLATGDTAAALATLDRAMVYNPSSPVPLAEMANYWLQVKDTTKAIHYAEKAAQLPPPNQGLLLFLKNYFYWKGDRAKADYYQNQALNAATF